MKLPNYDDTTSGLPPIVSQGNDLKQDGYFKNSNPTTGEPATVITASFFNKLLGTFRHTYSDAGVVDDLTKLSSLTDAIKSIAISVLSPTKALAKNNAARLDALNFDGDDVTVSTQFPKRNVVTVTEDYDAQHGDYVICDTSAGGFNVTLPDEEQLGLSVIIDRDGPNIPTVLRNGKTINKLAENMPIKTNLVILEFIDLGNDWKSFVKNNI